MLVCTAYKVYSNQLDHIHKVEKRSQKYLFLIRLLCLHFLSMLSGVFLFFYKLAYSNVVFNTFLYCFYLFMHFKKTATMYGFLLGIIQSILLAKELLLCNNEASYLIAINVIIMPILGLFEGWLSSYNFKFVSRGARAVLRINSGIIFLAAGFIWFGVSLVSYQEMILAFSIVTFLAALIFRCPHRQATTVALLLTLADLRPQWYKKWFRHNVTELIYPHIPYPIGSLQAYGLVGFILTFALLFLSWLGSIMMRLFCYPTSPGSVHSNCIKAPKN